MDYFEVLVQQLKTGGPWALVGLMTLAMVWLARAYVKVRDTHDQYKDNLLKEMKGLLIESTSASVSQADTNERVARALEAMQNVR